MYMYHYVVSSVLKALKTLDADFTHCIIMYVEVGVMYQEHALLTVKYVVMNYMYVHYKEIYYKSENFHSKEIFGDYLQ